VAGGGGGGVAPQVGVGEGMSTGGIGGATGSGTGGSGGRGTGGAGGGGGGATDVLSAAQGFDGRASPSAGNASTHGFDRATGV